MKKLFTLVLFVTCMALGHAQTFVTIPQINTPVDLANCDDSPVLFEDTVTFVGYVVTSGGLCEVSSSSINGANGVRPFIWMNDTANDGAVGPNSGIEVMGVNWNTNQATSGFTSLLEGDIVEVTGVVGYYNGATQFQPLDNNSVNVIGLYTDTIKPVQLSVGTLNNASQVNNLTTGEPYQSTFIEVNDVVVTSVNPYGTGANARISFTVSDAAGNSMEVYDFFLAQRMSNWTALNPNSPATTGSFTPPTVGTVYESLKGVVEHSLNGCSGSGVGYRIHPFDTSHYQIGATAPAITNINTSVSVPTSSDPITVTADVQDFDGTLTSVDFYYSTNATAMPSTFPSAAMTLTTGNTYSFTIPAQADGSNIRYYIKAEDNDASISYYPNTPSSQTEPNTALIVVRDNGLSIKEIQMPLGSNSDASPFENQEVTIGGYVTASARNCDLGYVYIQDSANTEYAGIPLRGSLDLFNLYRNQWVEVTGTVTENFGFTSITVSNVVEGSRSYEVPAVVLDPSDTAEHRNMEKYESMLVRYENPNGKLYITNGNAGFGEYQFSTALGMTDNNNSRRGMGGRKRDGQAESSLYVQLVSDASYETTDGQMVYTPVVADTTMTMDAISGIIYYAFGTYKVTPRTNMDIEGLNVALDTTCTEPIYVSLIENNSIGNVSVYPNPAQNSFSIEHSLEYIKADLFSINGQLLDSKSIKGFETLTFDVSNYQNGMYILKLSSEEGALLQSNKVIINR